MAAVDSAEHHTEPKRPSRALRRSSSITASAVSISSTPAIRTRYMECHLVLRWLRHDPPGKIQLSTDFEYNDLR
jgi:hypothetical protein